jgi:hypothetical protein
MIASVLLSFLLPLLLSGPEFFESPERQFPRDLPLACLDTIALLLAFLLFLVAGFSFGYFLNIIILRVVYRWPGEKVRRLMWKCEVPETWLRDDDTSMNTVDWPATRQKGKRNYVLYRGVIGLGSTLYLATLIEAFITGMEEKSLAYFFVMIVVNALIGAAYSLVSWSYHEWLYRNPARPTGETPKTVP